MHPENQTRWIPDEVHVVSSTQGLTQIQASLFDKRHLSSVLSDDQLAPITFADDEQYLYVIRDDV